MKNFCFISLMILAASCTSLDGVKKNTNCTVWKDQAYLGPYSIEVVGKKVDWTGSCSGYNRGCHIVAISLDENNNVLSGPDTLGKIENNELKFSEKHPLTEWVNFTSVRTYPEQKIVKASVITNGVATENSYSFNDKCSNEESVAGGVALSLVEKAQSKDIK